MIKKKIRICFVGNINSVHLQKWVNYFKNSKFFDVFVISASKVSFPSVPYTYYDELLPSWFRRLPVIPKLTFLIKIFLFKRFLIKLNPDIIHIHQLESFGVLFGLTNYHPMIVSTWGSDIIDDTSNTKQGKKKREVLLGADLITATSNFLARGTEKFIGQTKKIEVVPFGIDLKIFNVKKMKKHRFVKGEVFNIGFFKHLKEKYGPDYIIRAFALVVKEYSNTRLFMVGRGELEEDLKTLARSLNIEKKVHFTGFIEKEKIPGMIRQMNLTVMPSVFESETFGVAALESEALGIPVVASEIGGVPEVIKHKETGVLVPSKDIGALSEAILRLINDENLREKMGEAGVRFVKENYDLEKNAVKMRRLYLKIIK